MRMDSRRWASPDAPVEANRVAVCHAAVCHAVVCHAVVCHAVDTDDEDEAPTGKPEYGDLLDADWLERVADARVRDDDLIDVGLTLDLDDRDDGDELAQVMDLDVGILLTSLPLPVSREGGGSSELNAGDGASPDSVTPDSVTPDGTERELGEGSLSIGALRDLL